MLNFKKLTLASVAAAVLLTNSLANEQKYIIGTASTGGTYYPVGVGIATIASLKLAKDKKITFSAITSAGSAENIDMMEKNEANFGILQGLFGSMAWQGKAKYENNAKKNLRSVTMLWQNVEHFTVAKEVATSGNIKDLKNLYGKAFSIGQRNSGTRVSGETIMEALGIEHKKMNIQYLGYTPASTSLQDGKILGMNTPAGSPVSAVTNAYATIGANKLKVLEFTDEDIANIQKAYPVWTRFVVAKDTYPGQKEDLNLIAQPNLLVTTKDTPEEVVYLLTKTIYENLPFLNQVHKITTNMSLQKALDGLPMPLHKGAAKYFTEQGIKIPDRLVDK